MVLPLLAGAAATAGEGLLAAGATTALTTAARALLPRVAAGLGRAAVAEGASALGSAATRRFAGTALANLAERRAAAMASGRLAGMAPPPGRMASLFKAVVPQSPAEWVGELGLEALGSAALYFSLPSDAPRAEAAAQAFGLGAGGSGVGRLAGAALELPKIGGLRPRLAQGVLRQGAQRGGMFGSFLGIAPLPALDSWQKEQGLLQQQELAQRDDQVRRQTLASLQANPYDTNRNDRAPLYG
jgi:hypothetical protein